jgi:hypothetical protein
LIYSFDEGGFEEMKTKSRFTIVLCVGLAIVAPLFLSHSPAQAQTCYETAEQILSTRYAWYWWFVNPPHFLWQKDPDVQGVILTEVIYDEDLDWIISVRGVDQNGDSLRVDFSATYGFGQASLYYRNQEQARITERYYEDNRLECSFICYLNPAVNFSYMLSYITEDTFHVEFRVGGDTISGLLPADEEMPIVLQQLHEAVGQMTDSALIAALDFTLLDSVACRFAVFLEELEGGKGVREGASALAAGLGDFFGPWATIGVGVVNAFLLSIQPDIPTLTEWCLIIFGVVLLGFITWVFLRRRRVAGVRV